MALIPSITLCDSPNVLKPMHQGSCGKVENKGFSASVLILIFELGGWRCSAMFAGHDVALLELKCERFERHGSFVVHEAFADREEIPLGGDAADFVEETAFGIDADADEVRVFLHLLNLGGFAEIFGGF